jgi:hypothetical protein
MGLRDKANSALLRVREHLRRSKVDSLSAVSWKAEGFAKRFNKVMARHRTKFNLLVGFSAFIVAGFFLHIVVGFIVLGFSLFAIEYLSGGN